MKSQLNSCWLYYTTVFLSCYNISDLSKVFWESGSVFLFFLFNYKINENKKWKKNNIKVKIFICFWSWKWRNDKNDGCCYIMLYILNVIFRCLNPSLLLTLWNHWHGHYARILSHQQKGNQPKIHSKYI